MKPSRSFVSLLTASSFLVLAVTGLLAFILPFSIRIVGLHALIGFVFIALIGFHGFNNQKPLTRYLKSRTFWTTSVILLGLTGLFFWQPAPVRAILGLSNNLGPALDRFEVSSDGFEYSYAPSPDYRMQLTVRAGSAFDVAPPPHLAIWLENASFYHIKTLRSPPDSAREALPYWDFKRRGWEEAMRDSKVTSLDGTVDLEMAGVSSATQNSSFDPADYILPADPDNPMPYRLLIEIDQPEDEQASLVYSVEIDNSNPSVFQLLELVGYPQREDDTEDGKQVWELYYVDDSFSSALALIDSALLTIERKQMDAESASTNQVVPER